jgi:hypothetical protein
MNVKPAEKIPPKRKRKGRGRKTDAPVKVPIAEGKVFVNSQIEIFCVVVTTISRNHFYIDILSQG